MNLLQGLLFFLMHLVYFGTHSISRVVPEVKEVIFNENQRQLVQEDLSTHESNCVLSQKVGASFHIHPALSSLIEGNLFGK
jgi:hypothetical protein